MECYYPKIWNKFHCIANHCEDSCCTDWEIVVDDYTQQMYESVSGELGVKLRNSMQVDQDGDVIFKGQTKRCPFWNTQELCDIHSELGEEYLCDTCREFPRICQDYGDFCEYDLSLACPEAARLMFAENEDLLSLQVETDEEYEEEPEYDRAEMELLKYARKELFQLLASKEEFDFYVFEQCAHKALALQKKLDPQLEYPLNDISVRDENWTDDTEQMLLRVLRSCNILSDSWGKLLEQSPILKQGKPKFAYIYARDFLYRKMLLCAYDHRVQECVHLVLFFVACGKMLCSRTDDESMIWQKLVKEVEYDSENLEYVLQQLHTPALDMQSLMSYLKGVEIVDIYDENGVFTGRTGRRFMRLKENEYFLCTHVFIANAEGKVLLQQRSATKRTRPNAWDITAGAVDSGESSLDAALREAKEEVGLDLPREQMQFIFRDVRKQCYHDVYYIQFDFQLEQCKLQESEVQKVKLIEKDELIEILQGMGHRSENYKNQMIDFLMENTD